MDIAKFIDGLTLWFSKEIAPISARISALEGRQPEKGEKGDPGKDFDPSALAGMFVSAEEKLSQKVDEFLQALPIPQDGKPGEPGKDADPEFIKTLVSEQVAEKIAQIPLPKDGIDGKSVEIEQVKALVDEVFAQIPPPKDGIDGKDGQSVDVEQVREMVISEFRSQAIFQNSELKQVCDEIVSQKIKAAVAEIPVPKDGVDGKDADLEVVKGLIQEEMKLIPPVETLSETEIRTIAQTEAAVILKTIELPSNGKDGKDGENGRDALDIEILPAIDETKTYPRGTYAQHKNGLWRTFQKSHGMKGWECILAGIAEVIIDQVDDRRFTIKTVLSTGEIIEKGFSMLNTIYKGVYEQASTYEKGDLVTWGGNIWHCKEDTAEQPKVGSQVWTLAVKRGRDYIEPAKLEKRDPKAPVKMS